MWLSHRTNQHRRSLQVCQSHNPPGFSFVAGFRGIDFLANNFGKSLALSSPTYGVITAAVDDEVGVPTDDGDGIGAGSGEGPMEP